MTISVTGPDGSNFAFPDGTPEAEISSALDSHYAQAGTPNESRGTSRAGKAADVSLPEGLVRATATGTPVVGGLLNKLDAATNALLAPLLDKYTPDNFEKLPEGSFNERYQHALDVQNAKDAEFQKDHPVLNTAAEVAGGLGSTGAALRAAPATMSRVLGLTGETLPQQVGQGIAAGAGLGAADSATRGEDAGTGAMIGAITGGVAPVAANLVGRAVNGVRGLRPPPRAPQVFEDVAGHPVPLTVGQQTQDPNIIMEEQRALRGADSPAANAAASEYFQGVQKPAVEAAGEAVARRMSPGGELTATTPQEGAEGLLNALGQRGQADAGEAARQAELLGTARQGLSRSLTPPSAPSNPLDAASVVQAQIGSMRQGEQQAVQQATDRVEQNSQRLMASFHPEGQVLANSPMEAGQVVSDAVSQARANAEGAYRDAYQTMRETPGHFHPASFNGISERIGSAVTTPDSIPINAETTPNAHQALGNLDEMLNGITQQRGENGRIIPRSGPLDAAAVDDARKRLNAYLRMAQQRGQTTGQWADASAMRDVIAEFDKEVEDAIRSGKFIGNGQNALGAMERARGLFSNYRKTFTRQGAGDQVGPAMESIVGRHEGQAAAPETVAKMVTSGAKAPLIGRRLVDLFGQDSPEVGAIRQGLLSQMTRDASGAALPADKAAGNIESMLRGSSLRDVYFTPEHQEALAQHARDLRGTIQAPRAATDVVTPAMQRIVGEGGGQAYTPQQVLDLTLGTKGVGQNPVGVQIAQHLKQTAGEQSPAFQALRSAAFERLHGADSSETAGNIREYLNGRGKAMADVLHAAPIERQALEDYAAVHEAAHARSAGPRTTGSKLLEDMKGVTGRQPTATDITAILNPRNGRERAVELAKSVIASEGENSPAHVAIKQGLWAQALENKTGPMDVGSKAVISKLQELLHGSGRPLAQAVYSADERALMQSYLDLTRKITPPNGTVNYSNTSSVLMKAFRGGIDSLFGGLGMFHFGPVGVLAGHAADRSQGAVRDVIRSARMARLLFGTPQGIHAAANLQRDLGRLMSFGQRATLPAMH
jgi:hypothetical protein